MIKTAIENVGNELHINPRQSLVLMVAECSRRVVLTDVGGSDH